MRYGNKLYWFDVTASSSPWWMLAREGVRQILGSFPSPPTGGVGCVYLHESGNLVATCPYGGSAPIRPGWFDSETPGLGLVSASAWLDVNEMTHVYGLDDSRTLKVLHQASWGSEGNPAWSRSTPKRRITASSRPQSHPRMTSSSPSGRTSSAR
jgi:hypothetical protein